MEEICIIQDIETKEYISTFRGYEARFDKDIQQAANFYSIKLAVDAMNMDYIKEILEDRMVEIKTYYKF